MDCSVLKNFKNVKLNASNTASNTIVLFGKLNDKSVAMKIYPNFYDFPELQKYQYNFDGLQYEKKVYAYKVSYMLNMCDNFIDYVGYIECKLSSFPKHIQRLILSKKIKSKDDLTYGEIINAETCLYCLITEVISHKYLLQTHALGDVYDQLNKEDRKLVMIQIFWALEVMNKFKLVHNDLHAMNIILAQYTEPITIKIRDGTIETYFVPYIYDWDYSYSPLLGLNKRIDEYYSCNDINVCNIFAPKMDIYILLCFLRHKYPELNDDILDMFTENKLYKYQETNKRVQLSPKSFKNLLPYKSGESREDKTIMYKISIENLKDILTKKEFRNFTRGINIQGSILFALEDGYIVHKNGFHCRPSAFDEKMLLPSQMLDKTISSA
jgi:hypothetical protein